MWVIACGSVSVSHEASRMIYQDMCHCPKCHRHCCGEYPAAFLLKKNFKLESELPILSQRLSTVCIINVRVSYVRKCGAEEIWNPKILSEREIESCEYCVNKSDKKMKQDSAMKKRCDQN
jgi:hypothetical protein